MLGCLVYSATGFDLFFTFAYWEGIMVICFWSVETSYSVELLGSLLNRESINKVGCWVSY